MSTPNQSEANSLSDHPDFTDDADYSARVNGRSYHAFLTHLHNTLKPANYFEIGTEAGGTLRLANCPTIAVDPRFRVTSDVIGPKPVCMLFQQTSDDFFANRNPSELFGAAIDLAFLDGMHRFEFLLRDFINTERHCRRNSIVILHDCLPPGFYMTVRDRNDPLWKKSRFKDWWTGDVWKLVPVLQNYRPDLSIRLLDCRPTGLVVITNLDSKNSILQDAYDSILDRHLQPELDRGQFESFWGRVCVEHVSELETQEKLKAALRPS
jgi:hypothetical protein